jgi:CDP-diacylglycerol---glycerol-3-phosphate 3-phosphatidyltransferase
VARILVTPILVLLILSPSRAAAYLAATLFVVAAASDSVDGYLARRYEITSRLGQWLDPLADKILITAPVVTLTAIDRFPLWAAAVIVVREFAVSALRAWLGSGGRAMPASWWGKVKTTAQMVAVLLYLLPDLGPEVRDVRFAILVVAIVLTVFSGLDYFVRAIRPARRAG